MRNSVSKLIYIASVLAIMTGDTMADDSRITISGDFGYRERILPPPGASALVKLEDVSLADAKAPVLAQTKFTIETGPPYKYALSVPAKSLQPQTRYNVRVEIRGRDDQLLWTTDRTNPIDPTADNQTLPTIMLVKVGGRGVGHLMHQLAGEPWKVDSIDGRPVLERAPVTLVFKNGTISGSTGCNAYRGKIDLGKNGEAQTEILAVTARACIPDLDDQQTRFLRAIRSARHVRTNRDGALIVRSAKGGEIIAKR
jgi:uncharacterized lipoprotein YbaY/heat shock protein HslJ